MIQNNNEVLQNTPLLAAAVSGLPKSAFLQVALAPVFDLISCYRMILKHRRLEARYAIQAALIVAGIITGIVLTVIPNAYTEWLKSTITFTDIEVFGLYINVWLFGYVPSAMFYVAANGYYLVKYGDATYYLTRSRLERMAPTQRLVNDLGLTLLTPQAHELTKEDLLDMFNYLLSSHNDGKIIINSRSKPILEVLDIFMYGSELQIKEYYYAHAPFYQASLLIISGESINSDPKCIINNVAYMDRLATTFGVQDQVTPTRTIPKAEIIQKVLKYCLFRMKSENGTSVSSTENWVIVISRILSGVGHAEFLRIYRDEIQHRKNIEDLQAAALNAEQHLALMRRSPRATMVEPSTPQYLGSSSASSSSTHSRLPKLRIDTSKVSHTAEAPRDSSPMETALNRAMLDLLSKICVDDESVHQYIDPHTGQVNDAGIMRVQNYIAAETTRLNDELATLPPPPGLDAVRALQQALRSRIGVISTINQSVPQILGHNLPGSRLGHSTLTLDTAHALARHGTLDDEAVNRQVNSAEAGTPGMINYIRGLGHHNQPQNVLRHESTPYPEHGRIHQRELEEEDDEENQRAPIRRRTPTATSLLVFQQHLNRLGLQAASRAAIRGTGLRPVNSAPPAIEQISSTNGEPGTPDPRNPEPLSPSRPEPGPPDMV